MLLYTIGTISCFATLGQFNKIYIVYLSALVSYKGKKIYLKANKILYELGDYRNEYTVDNLYIGAWGELFFSGGFEISILGNNKNNTIVFRVKNRMFGPCKVLAFRPGKWMDTIINFDIQKEISKRRAIELKKRFEPITQ